MHTDREQVSTKDQLSEDDMAEGDLGDGSRMVGGNRRSQNRTKGDLLDLLPNLKPSKWGCEGNGGSFAWTSCSAMYTAFRKELEAERISQWRIRDSGSIAGDSTETLQRRLQEVTEEVELLRTELEVSHRHLQGKLEALRILQGQAILDKATSHTKILLQKNEERIKALEKEVNALQWEITFNQVQFKNVEHTWELKYERVCVENQALCKALDERLEQFQELHKENTSLSQQCLELLGLLSSHERRDFRKTQPPCSQSREGSALELAVYGACKCSSSVGEPCSCAKSAAASRKQVLQLKKELELQRRRKDEAYVMVDAFRIAFEQQLRRGSEKVLQLAENDMNAPERGKQSSAGVTQALKRLLPSPREGKDPSNPRETLQLLLDLLSDKEEALAHQRKVSYMLARSYEDMEKRLQAQMKELDISNKGAVFIAQSDKSLQSADSESDRPPCSHDDNMLAVMDEHVEKMTMVASENEGKV